MYEEELEKIQETIIGSSTTDPDKPVINQLIDFGSVEIDYDTPEQTNSTEVVGVPKDQKSFLKFIKYAVNNKTTGCYILVDKEQLTYERLQKLIEMYPNGCLFNIEHLNTIDCDVSVANYTSNYFILSPIINHKNKSGMFKLAGAKVPYYIKSDYRGYIPRPVPIKGKIDLVCLWFDGVVLDQNIRRALHEKMITFLEDTTNKLYKDMNNAERKGLTDKSISISRKIRITEKVDHILKNNILTYISLDGKKTPADVLSRPQYRYTKFGYTNYNISLLHAYGILNDMNVGYNTLSFDTLINILSTVIEEYKIMKL